MTLTCLPSSSVYMSLSVHRGPTCETKSRQVPMHMFSSFPQALINL
eukprot:CAMPEP_0176330108 /NCGR_PEP_ID=MMETSP0121_2-20121125/75845_1 /TAXON_ID=160619 /ORGANISM="Kryptoperidinium foliaceum, Strain CCMP 1326" /LENGTH=45 /DNA_ID= /DNA_START= /DNA_END= /DNA_ORIENTATION=